MEVWSEVRVERGVPLGEDGGMTCSDAALCVLLCVLAPLQEMTIPWCLKRAELVFKCVKGKGGWGVEENTRKNQI